MTTVTEAVRPMEDPEASLETALIAEFLRARGVDATTLGLMPKRYAEVLMRMASTHASAMLAEMEARAHFVREIHGAE